MKQGGRKPQVVPSGSDERFQFDTIRDAYPMIRDNVLKRTELLCDCFANQIALVEALRTRANKMTESKHKP